MNNVNLSPKTLRAYSYQALASALMIGNGSWTHFYLPQTKFAKVMFSQVFVCPRGGVSASGGLHPGGGGVCIGGVCIQGGWPDPTMGYYGIRATSGMYASYWNAFLSTM